MRIDFWRFAIIPHFSVVLSELVKDGDQRFEGGGTPIGCNLSTGGDGNLQNFSGIGHDVKCDCDDDRRECDASQARHANEGAGSKRHNRGPEELHTSNENKISHRSGRCKWQSLESH